MNTNDNHCTTFTRWIPGYNY